MKFFEKGYHAQMNSSYPFSFQLKFFFTFFFLVLFLLLLLPVQLMLLLVQLLLPSLSLLLPSIKQRFDKCNAHKSLREENYFLFFSDVFLLSTTNYYFLSMLSTVAAAIYNCN